VSAVEEKSFAYKFFNKLFYKLARSYLRLKKPYLIVTAGSVGKTSAKMFIGQLLEAEKKVRYMSDSYNSGLGLYLSVFNIKVPTVIYNPFAWIWRIVTALVNFLLPGPDYMVLEYGISAIGEMDQMLEFSKPTVGVLTAVTPEHMEFLKDIDTVAFEETKIIPASKEIALVSANDVDEKYRKGLSEVYLFGDTKDSEARYKIHQVDGNGARVDFIIGDIRLEDINLKIVSEPLIRQLCGAVALAVRVGVSERSILEVLKKIESVPGRMRLLKGVNDSSLIDDTANFSPAAGVSALKTLKIFKAKRRIVVFGNMHELGDYEAKGFSDVGMEFKDIDQFIFVGPLARKYFTPIALKAGYELGKNLFEFDDAVTAGKAVRQMLQADDEVLIKGPFGGFYLEECTKQLLNNPKDLTKLTRQSNFWLRKKRELFKETK
jgi:UDP-N-acetylmuramyl pentapeptide synthase